MGYDPAAPTSNFQSPGNTDDTVAYNISVSSDSTYVDINLTADPAAGGAYNGLSFINLYLSTDYPGGSTLGLSANQTGFTSTFIPGGANFAAPSPSDGLILTVSPTGDSYNVEIPWTYLTTDPDGIGFEKISAANPVVRLDLSQSFSYSVAGGSGDPYGMAELGTATYSPVPEPSTIIAGSLILLPMGTGFLRKLRGKPTA